MLYMCGGHSEKNALKTEGFDTNKTGAARNKESWGFGVGEFASQRHANCILG